MFQKLDSEMNIFWELNFDWEGSTESDFKVNLNFLTKIFGLFPSREKRTSLFSDEV